MSEKKEIFRTDWLASYPVFYNERTGKASHNINDVIEFDNFEFHPEGFNNYLDFGFSVFEQTPIKNVKFLRHSSRLLRDERGDLEVEYLDDPAEEWIGRVKSEKEIWELLEATVKSWENQVHGEIVVPTSGGFDSRLMNYFLSDKSRIRAFTFGTSQQQEKSYEVIHARKITEILDINWKHIILENFHRYFGLWDDLYGISTHAHGMYQIEFYKKVNAYFNDTRPLLSGILGDGWSGGKKWPPIKKSSDVIAVGLSHGMHADSQQSLIDSGHDLRDEYYQLHREKLANPSWVVIESMRFKMTLLSYLFRVPMYFDFSPWTPFFDIEIALSMLALPFERRYRRTWQVEFLKKHNIYFKELDLEQDYTIRINHTTTRSYPLEPLRVEILREVIRPKYIEWINRIVREMPEPNKIIKKLLHVRKVGTALRMMGVKSKDPFLQAYCAYLTLKPIETILEKRGPN